MKSLKSCAAVTLGLFAIELIAIALGNKPFTEYWKDHYLVLVALPMIYGPILGLLVQALMELDNDTAYIPAPTASGAPAATPTAAQAKLKKAHMCKLFFTLAGMGFLFGHFLFTVVPIEAASQTIVRNIHFVEPHTTPLIHVNKEVKGATAPAPVAGAAPAAMSGWTAFDPADPTTPLKFSPDEYDILTIEDGSLPDATIYKDGTIRVTIVLKREDAVMHGILIPKNRVKDYVTRGELWFQEKDEKDTKMAPFG